MESYVLIYLLAANVAAFLVFGIDKWKAVRQVEDSGKDTASFCGSGRLSGSTGRNVCISS